MRLEVAYDEDGRPKVKSAQPSLCSLVHWRLRVLRASLCVLKPASVRNAVKIRAAAKSCARAKLMRSQLLGMNIGTQEETKNKT